MPTLDELQKLGDAPFHQLCDDLVRRLEPRYRRLRTHGINPQGRSIKGQPDSYVGETANTCQIAFVYSAQKKSWWTKMVQDVEEAIQASPGVEEIVVATPRDVNRDGPRLKKVDWFSPVKAAARTAKLQIYDGPAIAGYLDREHQDLRFEHLRIPYSRLSGPSILASCREANAEAIAELTTKRLYDPDRYTPRAADRELFGLWQSALRTSAKHGSSKSETTRFIPLVNDSGVGKTSLLAAFVQSLGSLPAIFLQARNLSFASEDSLVAHVIHALQGVLAPKVRSEEEAAIANCLAAGTPMTVVLDGLDESKEAATVRKAITFWLKSKLGQVSVLVVSSRPEFWKACKDRGWGRWMSKETVDDRKPVSVAKRSSVDRTDLLDGICLPDKFTEGELEAAWRRAGRSLEQLFALPVEAREDLRHPFTLRVYLDLFSAGSVPAGPITRAELLEMWLNGRLDAEAVERLTREQFQEALRAIATRLAEAGAGSLLVDDLADAGVPRFDPTHPPGPVVERLIAANILESVPGSPDRIRFAVEAVQDFYRADGEVKAIVDAPAEMAKRFAEIRFTEAYPRLNRIGQLIVNHEVRQEFVRRLADDDVCKAAIVIRADPSRYTAEIRQKIAAELGRQIESPHRVRGAFAIHLLSDLHCKESCECLAAHLLTPAPAAPLLKNVRDCRVRQARM